MKNVLLIFAMLLLQVGVFAQVSDVPANVQKTFKAKCPSSTDVEWTAGESYTASFWVGTLYKEAIFASNGQWVQTSTVMDEEELPESVKSSLKTTLGEIYITYILKLETNNGSASYVIDLSSETENLQVTTDMAGQILKKIVMEDEDDGF